MVSDLEGTLGRSFAAEAGSSRLRVKTAGVSSAGGVAVGVLFSSTVPYMVSEKSAQWQNEPLTGCSSTRPRPTGKRVPILTT
jgi:hypothetical protein